ncbi:MAG: peptidoglycan DD-metalloendopeptidase family protein [Flavobacteriaceae bacterium]|nr:peptidoglycan DD-metalloendopeptidase family protein [Flavobacteriaceae bacterium]
MFTLLPLCILAQGQDHSEYDLSLNQVEINSTTGLPYNWIPIPLNLTKAEKVVDIKAENWRNDIYNPYRDAVVKFPFQVHFEDSLYKAPILKDMVITSRFGWRRGRAHKGIDIDLVTGDEVVSVLDGIVRFSGYNTGHGRTVVVRHFNGLETTYAHLSRYAVKANDTVRKGQLLGKGGVSGNARGSHLHMVVRYKGIAINPEYIFDFGPETRIRSQELWVTRKWTSAYNHSSRQRSKLELLTSEEEALASLEKEKKIYVVKRGDTLTRIANRNGISIRSILVANNIRYNSMLKIGQKLVIEP